MDRRSFIVYQNGDTITVFGRVWNLTPVENGWAIAESEGEQRWIHLSETIGLDDSWGHEGPCTFTLEAPK